MLDLDWVTIVFQIVNFVVLLWGLNRYLFRPLRARLVERRRTIADTLQSARDQEVEASRLREEWQERMEAAKREADEILNSAQLEADRKLAELQEEIRARADRLTEEMREDLARQRDDTIAQHYEGILDAIIDLSSNVVQAVTTRRTHDDLVTNFEANVYQLPQTEVDEYRRIMARRVPTAFVSTPVALSQEQAKTLADTLSSLIDRHVELQVTIAPELVAGIQVRLADKLIDNSIRQRLNRIRERVRRDLISRVGAGALYG